MKKILVTGSTGFLGKELTKHFEETDAEVIFVSRKWDKEDVKEDKNKRISVDLSKGINELGEFDVVINCASTLEGNDWQSVSGANIQLVDNLINSVKTTRFIQISTGSVFTPTSYKKKVPEPVNYYGISKLAAEWLVKMKRHEFSESIVIRFPIIIGKHKKTTDLFNYIYEKAKIGEGIELFNEGKSFKSFLHVREAAKSILSAATSNKALPFHEEIDVSSFDSMQSIDIANHILDFKKSGSKLKLSKVKRTNDFDSFFDVSKCSIIDYECKSSFHNLKLFVEEMNEI